MHSLDPSVSAIHTLTAGVPSAESDESTCAGNGVTSDAYDDCSTPLMQQHDLIS